MNRWLLHPLAKPLVFVACCWPACALVWDALLGQLGANPAEALIRSTGDWTLRALCLALAVTPLRVVGQLPALARFRRMLGLFVFFYAMLHALSYGTFDMGWELGDMAHDLLKRPFIMVGFMAWVVFGLLAVTSFQRAVRWLGGRRWQALHRGVYAAAVLSCLHFFWMRAGKNDVVEVAVYAAILAGLLAWRATRHVRQWLQRRPLT